MATLTLWLYTLAVSTLIAMLDLKRRLGKAIRRLRLERKVGQERFAHDVGLHRVTMARVEKGADISISTLEKIAEGLGISAAELVRQAEEEGRRKKPPQ